MKLSFLEFFNELKKNKGSIIGLIIILISIFLALMAKWISPHSPYTIFQNSLGLPPFFSENGVSTHLLGTDDLGRDLFSRLLYGSQISLGVGFAVVLFSLSLGVFLGAIAGYFEGILDKLIMGLTDLIMSLPSILLSIVIVAVIGPGIFNAILAVSIVSLPSFIRITRAEVLNQKKRQYVLASKLMGASSFRIIFKEILPNCFAPLIVSATLGFSDGILNVAALGFLGLGAEAPLAEWGTMLSDARNFIESSPWMVTLPGLCILITVLSFNVLGDGLRDALDPRLKKQS